MSLREFINIINFEKDAIADSLNELLSLNINESLKEYDVAGPAYLENLTGESDYHFRVKTNYFKFRVGEHVDIRMEQQGKLSKSLMECTVTAINFDKIGEVQATLEPTSLGSEIVPETNYYLTQKSMSGIYSRLLKKIKNKPSVASETDLKNLELNPNFLDLSVTSIHRNLLLEGEPVFLHEFVESGFLWSVSFIGWRSCTSCCRHRLRYVQVPRHWCLRDCRISDMGP